MADRCVVRSLHVYPVKGCAAWDVDALTFDADGLAIGDRVAAIVDAENGAFISQRHEPRLARLIARWRDAPNESRTLEIRCEAGGRVVDISRPGEVRRVTIWDDTFDAIDLGEEPAAFLSGWIGRRVRLVALPPRSPRIIDPYWAGENVRSSFADLAPILVTSASSLADANARRSASGLAAIEMARFRPNVVVEGLTPWAEDGITALTVGAGDAGLRLIKPCARCKVIELDPSDGSATGDEVLASLAKFRAGKNRRGTAGIFFGQNAVAIGGGNWTLRLGESLTVERSPNC